MNAVAYHTLEEQVKIGVWRLEEFQRLGFSPELANELAASDVDLALARRLRAAGCPLHMILRIAH